MEKDSIIPKSFALKEATYYKGTVTATDTTNNVDYRIDLAVLHEVESGENKLVAVRRIYDSGSQQSSLREECLMIAALEARIENEQSFMFYEDEDNPTQWTFDDCLMNVVLSGNTMYLFIQGVDDPIPFTAYLNKLSSRRIESV